MNNILVIGLNKRGLDFIKFLKSKKIHSEINGYDLDFDRFKNAVNKGLINNKESDNFEKIVIKSDIIILNISLDKYDTIFSKISAFLQKSCIITDINSSKEYIYIFKRKNLNIRKDNFIQSNCLFNFDHAEKLINKRILINSSVSSNLENVNRLSLFWKMYNFDTEIINVADNDLLMSKVLHLPFALKILLKKIIKGKGFFVNLKKSETYLYEDIFLNKDNVAKELKKFAILMGGMNFEGELSRAFFNKALKAREKLQKIYDIYNLKPKKESKEGDLFDTLNFLLETIFVGEFLNFREYFYLNMNAFNFGLVGGQEFICLSTIEKNKEKFLKIWDLLIKKLIDFAEFLSAKEELKFKDFIAYVEAD